MVAELVTGGLVVVRPQPIRFHTGFVQGMTLMSDLHVGAPNVNYKLIEQEIATAKQCGDRLMINGDLLDMILCGDHKRFSPDSLHPRLQGRRDVINEAVAWAVEVLAPVAEQLDMLGCGNHETAIERHHSYDPISAVIYELEKKLPKKSTHKIHHGGYGGFVDFRFNDAHKHGKRFVIYYHHGSGGQAPVTKGMIDFNRKDTWVESDLIWLGHKHNRWNASSQRVACPQSGDEPNVREVRHVMTGSYFHTYRGQSQASIRQNGRRTNYAADWGLAPQGQGGCRVELRFGPADESFKVFVIQ